MKNMRKLFALALALVMVLSLSVTAFAQTVDAGNGTATITVENPAKGETYAVYKLFDANVTGNEDGSIFYTGTIPESLAAYFEVKDTIGDVAVEEYIVAKEAAVDDNGDLTKAAVDAIAAWAKDQTAVVSEASNGEALTFTGLEYGYYVVTSTQGDKVISVTSTNPNGVIVDKNTTEPNLVKSVDDPDVNIGQTVTYTAKATTATWLGEAEKSEIVTQYLIHDTLPNYLSTVTITKITIGGEEYTVDGKVPQFVEVDGYDNKAVVIPWAAIGEDGKYYSLYANGAEIVVTYTAVVTDEAVIDGAGNKNVVTLVPYTTPDEPTEPDPWEKEWKDDETIFTYATALRKVDENNAPLAGAKFKAMGLTVVPAKTVATETTEAQVIPGSYIVTAYDPESTEYGTEMTTDENGHLYILGIPRYVDEDAEEPVDFFLTLMETEAPAGYNKLVDTIELKTVVTGQQIKHSAGYVKYDANGNITEADQSEYDSTISYNVKLLQEAIMVVNQKGTELPSTGGVGTTMFYVIGALLVLSSAVLLVTKKRMGAAE